MKVDKREFVPEFSQFSCPGQSRTGLTRKLMKVDKRGFIPAFHFLLTLPVIKFTLSNGLPLTVVLKK